MSTTVVSLIERVRNIGADKKKKPTGKMGEENSSQK
jgi:hypothetical protein